MRAGPRIGANSPTAVLLAFDPMAVTVLEEQPTGNFSIRGIDVFSVVQPNAGSRHEPALTSYCGGGTPTNYAPGCGSLLGSRQEASFVGTHLDDHALDTLAARIVAGLHRFVEHGGRSLHLGASVGIARAEGCTAAELFARADAALYAAKAAGRNTHRVFRTAMLGAA